MFFISAHELREEKLNSVPNNKPGYYRWWVPRDRLASWLNSSYLTKPYMQELLPYLQKREHNQNEYFCVYVGVAIGQSIQSRLKKHILGTWRGSTLRESISALIAGKDDEDITNKLIDSFIVEYCVLDYPVKDKQAKVILEEKEEDELKKHVLPLNIKKNTRREGLPVLKNFLNELTIVRRGGFPK